MKAVRAFVAVLIDDELRRNIAAAQDSVREYAPEVKWVAPENFHITLKFLGEIDEQTVPEASAAIEAVAGAFAPFELSFAGLGVFPDLTRAKVVWVGADRGAVELASLALAADNAVAGLGVSKQSAPFRAHLTVGRVKTMRPPAGLARGISEAHAADLGTQRVESIALMRSELMREGPIYTPISIHGLGG